MGGAFNHIDYDLEILRPRFFLWDILLKLCKKLTFSGTNLLCSMSYSCVYYEIVACIVNSL